MKTALITGITGQDGSYLAELLLEKGYKVYGLVRRLSTPNYERIAHILDDITLVQGDMLDQSSLLCAIIQTEPDEIYNLAAMSHVGTSFVQPAVASEVNALGVLRLLEAIRHSNPGIRIYQASTSEMFGVSEDIIQDENTRLKPRSPYGTSKVFAHNTVKNYRDSYGIYAVSGILFNHESPRRGLEFVTRKITDGLARIKYGLQATVKLGDVTIQRDWGYARDYVQAMWLMLQQEKPDDYVIATGETHSICEFFQLACEAAELPLPYQKYIETDVHMYRPADIYCLRGNASKAQKALNWQPHTPFSELVSLMIQADLRRVLHEIQVQSVAHSRFCACGSTGILPVSAV